MVEVPVYDIQGQKIDSLKVDEAIFGGTVNVQLLKQAIDTYHANRRQGTVHTKNLADVEGSTRKLYKQKHTGNARRGNIRTNVMRGGGMAHAKRPRDYRKDFPRNMRKAALNSALLAKMLGNDLMVVDGLKVEKPKTAQLAELLKKLQINRSCLLALAALDKNIYLSARNIPDLTVHITADLNAFDVATRQKLLVTSEAMKALLAREVKHSMKNDIYTVVIKPLVTEKGTHQSQTRNAYAFQVAAGANKAQIKDAVEKIYKVKVLAVRTANRKGKPRRTGYTWGTTSHWKKAVVVLHGDHHIDLF